MNRRMGYMMLALLLALSVALVVGCGSSSSTETTEGALGTATTESMFGTETTESMFGTETTAGAMGTETTMGTAMTGAEVYTNNCATCHGENGEGVSGPALTGITLSESQVADQVRNGGGGMPAFSGQLSDTEIQNVAQYVVTTFGQ